MIAGWIIFTNGLVWRHIRDRTRCVELAQPRYASLRDALDRIWVAATVSAVAMRGGK